MAMVGIMGSLGRWMVADLGLGLVVVVGEAGVRWWHVGWWMDFVCCLCVESGLFCGSVSCVLVGILGWHWRKWWGGVVWVGN